MADLQFRGRIDTRATDKLQKKLNDLPNALTKTDAKKMGEDAVQQMKAAILKGDSPIAGWGRFPAYKNPKKYPGGQKPSRPVNLYLSGAFLAALTSRVVQARFGYSASIGYDGRNQQVKERGHREGANGQPARPTIPQGGAGELFIPKIQSAIRRAMLAAIQKVARR